MWKNENKKSQRDYMYSRKKKTSNICHLSDVVRKEKERKIV